MSGVPGVPGVPRVSAEDVRAALGRLSTSPLFAGAERMRRFLQLVVEETLAGNAGSLKEYRIGVDVFDRGQTFDPRTDTIVRVEARRLRQKLEEYYAGTGRHDPVIAGLGDVDHSLEWLERAADLKVPQLIWIDFQPPWRLLRGSQRFEDIRKRMHLPMRAEGSIAP